MRGRSAEGDQADEAEQERDLKWARRPALQARPDR
jgi:hypothetical protein